MQALDSEVAQLVRTDDDRILIAGQSFAIEQVTDVEILPKLPPRYLLLARVSGGLWALVGLAWAGVFLFTGESSERQWLYLLLGVVVLLPAAYYFANYLDSTQRVLWSTLFWAFAWVMLAGLSALYLLSIVGMVGSDNDWFSWAIYSSAGISMLNLLVSLALVSTQNRALFTLRVVYKAGARDAFTSSDEELIGTMATYVRTMLDTAGRQTHMPSNR